jgi:hypothetical protein
MGSGFISRSDDVPDLMLMVEARPTEDGQPYLIGRRDAKGTGTGTGYEPNA